MRIYIANEGDTLHKIANRNQIDIAELLSLNLHIADPNRSIAGKQVKLPAIGIPSTNYIPPSCPPAAPLDYLNTWIPLTPLEQMAETEYDVLIVGSGAGGGAALWRLCEQWKANGKRIGIVEAGDPILPTHAFNIPTLNQNRFQSLFQNIEIPIGKNLPEFPGATQLYALGGRTLFWTAVTPRMLSSEIQGWPITSKEMNLYYNIAERVMNVTQGYTAGSSISQILLDRLQRSRFTQAAAYPMAVDLQPTQYGNVHSNVFFSSMNFFAYALNLRPFDLAVRARAIRVAAENGKVMGVEVMSPDKKSYFLKSKIVVLAASTFETPRILLYSGIKGRAIGHYLTNHSFITATGKLTRNEFPEVLGTLGIIIPQTEEYPYQFQMFGPGPYFWYHYEEEPLRKEWPIVFQGFGVVESRFDNQVFLNPYKRDAYGVPEIQIQFSHNERDKAIIRQMSQDMRLVSNVTGVPLISTNGENPICLMPPGIEYHATGTCRMGDESYNAATNRYGEIFSVSGLFIADNSILPTLPAANPTLTTVALAIRTADYIIQTSPLGED
ncbi:GMC oxidoreductase [Paenibacillus sp. BR2-3]|uniref:GMC oxidoreductase n=1 Tax=Paenibacillus sp. BR2-3 TaxID=3048494 RepID=UPI003977270B